MTLRVASLRAQTWALFPHFPLKLINSNVWWKLREGTADLFCKLMMPLTVTCLINICGYFIKRKKISEAPSCRVRLLTLGFGSG